VFHGGIANLEIANWNGAFWKRSLRSGDASDEARKTGMLPEQHAKNL
jgi:hypothetical protein